MESYNGKRYTECDNCLCDECIHNNGFCSGCEKCIGSATYECPIGMFKNEQGD